MNFRGPHPSLIASGPHIPMDDSDDDGSLERKGTSSSTPAAPVDAEEKKKMGRPRIEGVERDPVSDRIKKPRPPPSEKQLQVLKEAREKRAAFVAERKRLADEAKEKAKKVGVTKSALEETKKEAEIAKAEMEKLKAELEQERAKKVAEEALPQPAAPSPKQEEPPRKPRYKKRPAAAPTAKPKKKATKKYDSSSSSDSDSESDSDVVVSKPFQVYFY